MKQTSLFEGSDGETGMLPIPGSLRALTGAQRRFNSLVQRVEALLEQREQWQRFAPQHAAEVATKLTPLAQQLREQQVSLVRLFERQLKHPALGKRGRETLRDWMLKILAELLQEEHAPELAKIFERYSGIDLAEEESFAFEMLRAAAAELGVDVDSYAGDCTPESFSNWVDDQLEAPQSQRRDSRGAPRLKPASPSGAASLRRTYRQLAGALHPDREADPAQRERKTVLMQELNAAYGAGDVLKVLKLGQSVGRSFRANLADLPAEDLQPYIESLQAQADQLRRDVAELAAPFVALFPHKSPASLTPGFVQEQFAKMLAEVRAQQALVTADLARFANIDALKAAVQRPSKASKPRRRC